jgi:hypothetical protein
MRATRAASQSAFVAAKPVALMVKAVEPLFVRPVVVVREATRAELVSAVVPSLLKIWIDKVSVSPAKESIL